MTDSSRSKPIWSYAFRPFFLGMAAHALLSLVLWVFVLHGRGPDFLPVNAVYWHGHEMLVGFGMAAVAGFTLTAVATWTGRPPVSGGLLVLLVLSWLSGRLALLFAGILPAGLVASVDSVFPLLLMVLLGREVVMAGNRRNLPIVFIMFLLAAFNALYHAGRLGWISLNVDAERLGLYLLIHLLLLLITVISGRIVPNFTANWLRSRGVEKLPVTGGLIERLVLPVTLLTGLYLSLAPHSLVTSGLALTAAVLHFLRVMRWRGLATAREPLLFVLHLAYCWLPLGYFLSGAAILGWGVPATAAMHSLTVGGATFMILAISSRVSLAHTGRQLYATRLTVAAYCLMLLAATVRVLSPFGSAYLTLIDTAAVFWVLSFAIFLWVYFPILTGEAVGENSA